MIVWTRFHQPATPIPATSSSAAATANTSRPRRAGRRWAGVARESSPTGTRSAGSIALKDTGASCLAKYESKAAATRASGSGPGPAVPPGRASGSRGSVMATPGREVGAQDGERAMDE